MCGLVALLAKRTSGFFSPDPDIFQQLLYADAIRGWDATGVFGVNKAGNVDIKKQALAAGAFLTNPGYLEFHNKILPQYMMIIGHNRKATHGTKVDDNAHPFWSDNNKIVLVHNGMVSNQKDFCTKASVDSEAVCNALAVADDPKDVLKLVTGAFAFIWYNTAEKKLYFIRNETRPLWIVETVNTYAIVSEDDLAKWVFGRNKQTVTKVTNITPMELFSIDLGKSEIKSEGMVKKETPFFPIIHTGINNTKNGGATAPMLTTIGVGDIETTGFTNKDQIKSLEQALRIFKKDKKVFFDIEDYQECLNKTTGEIAYKIQGLITNVELPNLKVTYFLSKNDFDLADFTEVHSGTIQGVSVNKEKQTATFFVKDIDEHRVAITHNKLKITDDLYMENGFNNVCRCCKQTIPFGKIQNCFVELKHDHAECLCPTCTTRFNK